MNKFWVYISSLFLILASCNNNTGSESTVPVGNSPVNAGVQNEEVQTIVFFGNSLTAGYGIPISQAFPSIIQHKIDSLDLNYKVVNAGVSGETTAGGRTRIDWLLKQQHVDVFVLELGANDGLRGLPVSEAKENLQIIINKVRAAYPNAKIILAGMQIPPSMGQQYAQSFSEMYTDLSRENNITLVPFLLKGVGGEPGLNLADGIHPSAEGHKILAENVWDVLRPTL